MNITNGQHTNGLRKLAGAPPISRGPAFAGVLRTVFRQVALPLEAGQGGKHQGNKGEKAKEAQTDGRRR